MFTMLNVCIDELSILLHRNFCYAKSNLMFATVKTDETFMMRPMKENKSEI